MNRKMAFNVWNSAFVLLFIMMTVQIGQANEKEGFQGWELGSEYNSFYNYKELDKLKGVITRFIEVTPMPGMAKGTAFLLDEGDGEEIQVQLCPVAFAKANETGLRRGMTAKVRGSWAFINGKDVFLASKVKQGESFEFKVRLTKDGTPFWTMSQEEMAKEATAD